MVENNFCKNKKTKHCIAAILEKIELFLKSIHERAKQYCFNNIDRSVLKSIQSVLGRAWGEKKNKEINFPLTQQRKGESSQVLSWEIYFSYSKTLSRIQKYRIVPFPKARFFRRSQKGGL